MVAKVELRERARAHLLGSARTKDATADVCLIDIEQAAEIIARAFLMKKKLLLCGNGGSAADCQHMAAEFVSRLTKNFDRPALPAIALTTDTSFITAYANDVDFDGIFARQVAAIGQTGDVLIGISTSGTSNNVLVALRQATEQGMSTILLTSEGGKNEVRVNVCIAVPSENMQHVQETHLAIEHILCDLVERHLFAK
jgi:D-sedoheptulose 7-phosphate isomerase